MTSPDYTLAAMAEIGAMRKLLVHAIALRLIDEPSPLQTLDLIDLQLTSTPTKPPASARGMDPAVSDYLAALTDERTQALVDDVRARLAMLVG